MQSILRNKFFKGIAVVVLATFITMAARLDVYAAVKNTPREVRRQEVDERATKPSAAEDFSESLAEIEKLLAGIDEELAKKEEAAAELEAVKSKQAGLKGLHQAPARKESRQLQKKAQALQETKTKIEQAVASSLKALDLKRSRIEESDRAIRKEFKETERKLKQAKLSDEILQRHYDFVAKYEENMQTLLDNLDGVRKAKPTELRQKMQAAKSHLEQNKPPSRHTPLDPNNLPHRMMKLKPRKPRVSPEEFKQGSGGAGEPRSGGVEKQGGGTAGETGRQGAGEQGRGGVEAQGSKKQGNGDKRQELEQGQPKKAPQRAPALQEPKAQTQQRTAKAPPTDADLAQTIEVQFTQEIRDLADTLGHNPVKIYEYVRNNFEYEPYYGSLKGAQETLWEKAGNDFDLASLLIALYRASGIPARYVYGTIEVPIEKAMNWVGVEDPTTCADLFASNGIPVAQMIPEGGQVAKKLRMEHVWVEAWVTYDHYRGAVQTPHNKMWIPLDPSFKQYAYEEGVNLAEAINFDAQSFLNEIQQQSTVNKDGSVIINETFLQQKMAEDQASLDSYLDENFPDGTLFDVLGSRRIVEEKFGILPGSFPYKRVNPGDKFSEISDNLRHKIRFEAEGNNWEPGLSYRAFLPEIAGKRITLSCVGATEVDREVLQNYEGIENVPAYLVEMKPVLMIAGEPVATGSAVRLGATQTFSIEFTLPDNLLTDRITNELTVGGYHAIGINLQQVPQKLLNESQTNVQRIVNLINQGEGYVTGDDVLGEFLHGIAMTYFCELDALNKVTEKMTGTTSIRGPSQTIVSAPLSSSSLFGFPVGVKTTGLSIDVDRDIHSTFPVDGDIDKKKVFAAQGGMNGSILESGIFEHMLGDTVPAISAVKIIQTANSQGIPIYQVRRDNIAQILPLLQVSSDVKNDIRNAINAGMVVTIPKTDITLNDWTGAGYIVMNPETGEAGYMISGGIAGGHYGWDMIKDFCNAILAIIGALETAGEISIGLFLGILMKFTTLVQPLISWWDALKEVENANLTPETKRMLNQFVHLCGVLAGGAALGTIIAGPVGLAMIALVLVYINMLFNIIIPMLVLTAQIIENYKRR